MTPDEERVMQRLQRSVRNSQRIMLLAAVAMLLNAVGFTVALVIGLWR